MTPSPIPAPLQLALTEDPLETPVGAPWIGPLVALGACASRYLGKLGRDRQLVVVVSVPQRDFAAALVGCGWVMTTAAPEPSEPIDVFRQLRPDAPVRVVTQSEVISDRFRSLDESKKRPHVRLSHSQWLVSGIRAAAAVSDETDKPARMPRPDPGFIARIARFDVAWDARLAAPAADLAIIGTLKWVSEDLAAYLSREGEQVVPDTMHDALRDTNAAERVGVLSGLGGTLANLLLPKDGKCATWFTRLYPSARFSDHLPLPHDLRAAILDGAAAIRYVAEVETPIVICILDRSVADETAGELVTQLRNSRGEPLSLHDDLEWWPPAGVEALAFTVAL